MRLIIVTTAFSLLILNLLAQDCRPINCKNVKNGDKCWTYCQDLVFREKRDSEINFEEKARKKAAAKKDNDKNSKQNKPNKRFRKT